jgi:hypothetical protein
MPVHRALRLALHLLAGLAVALRQCFARHQDVFTTRRNRRSATPPLHARANGIAAAIENSQFITEGFDTKTRFLQRSLHAAGRARPRHLGYYPVDRAIELLAAGGLEQQ